MKKLTVLWTTLIALSLVLASCRSATPTVETETPVNADAVLTAAASTANARMTENAAVTPTDPPPTATSTPLPPTPTVPAVTVTATIPAASPTTAGGAPVSGSGDRAEFVADVTVPDGTTYQPNETFVKTWRLQNMGTTTWTTAYTLNYVSGAMMGAPASVSLPQQVPPNTSVDISVNLTAPPDPGKYTGYFNLKNASGQTFGVGPNANEAFWVEINVAGAGATSAVTPGTTTAATSTATPGTPGATTNIVTNVAVTIDDANVTGACPHTFTLTGQFTLSSPTTVTYQLEAETGFDITLPSPVTAPLDAGTHTFTYTLDFSNSSSGWVRLRVTAPENVPSSQVTFSLTCE